MNTTLQTYCSRIRPGRTLFLTGPMRLWLALFLLWSGLAPAQSIDPTFNPGSGASDRVLSVVAQADGKVLIGGDFTRYNSTARSGIARLNADGTLDTGFNPGSGTDRFVNSVVVQADGKVLIGGGFTQYNGTDRSYIARLNADGSLDRGFDPGSGTDSFVNSVAVQADGKVLIGGGFTSYNGTARSRIARLLPSPLALTGFVASPAAVCLGSVATFTATVGNLTGSYSYTLTNGTSPTTGTATSATFSQGLAVSGTGTQTFTLTVNNGSQPASATTTLTVNPVPTSSPDLSRTLSPFACNTSRGLITFDTNLPDGSYTFSYRKDAGSPQTILVRVPNRQFSIPGLSAGRYYDFRLTNNGCTGTSSATVTLVDPAPPQISITPSATTICVGSPAQLTASGASTYQWSTQTSMATISVTATGTYSVTGVATNGCSGTASASVTVNELPSVSLLNNGPLACGGVASVTLTASPAGAGSFSFSAGASPSGPMANNTATVSTAGVYSVTLTANGCSNTASTTVTGSAILPNVNTFTTPTPNGLAVQVSGGVSYERVKLIDRVNGYEIRQTEQNQTGYFLIPQPGPYSITVIGSNGCRATVTGTK